MLQNVTIEMNDDINIFVGENDSGKTTILEALSMVLTGKINGSNVANRLNLDGFNAEVRQKFKESIEAGSTPDLPTIEIEVYFATPSEDEIAIKKFKQRFTRGYKRYKETSGLTEWKTGHIFHSIFT